jgi:glutamine---fructose-6-phosphate transaminase (isomerizing)
VMNDRKRCTRCLLPETYPAITFDGEGVCCFCAGWRRKELPGRKVLLDTILSAGRTATGGGKGDYDCIVGISGGKDSCYVAYHAAVELGLRVLAVSYDFPFFRDLARENARTVCDRLGIDLEIVRTRNDLEIDLLRNHIMSLAPTGTTWGQCIFCHYGIDAILYGKAREKNVPVILSGVTDHELWNPASRVKMLFKRVRNLSPSGIAGFVRHQTKAWLNLVDQRKQFPVPGNSCWNAYSRPRLPANGPETIKVFDYIRWDQKMIEKTLAAEAGWKKPERELTWRYDCRLEPLLDITYLKEFGVSTVGIYLSSMIREGLMTRAEALAALEESEKKETLRQSLEEVFDFLGIPAKEREAFDREFPV